MCFLLALFLLGQPDTLHPAPDSGPQRSIGRDTTKTRKSRPGARDTTGGLHRPGRGDHDTTAQESLDVVHYGGKQVVFNVDESKVYLTDSAWVKYKDMSLYSDSIIYDIKKNVLNSYKASRFMNASDSVVGDELHYNLNLHKGYMTRTNTGINQGYLTANDLWLVNDKTLDVNSGTYTTCNLKKPHYHFWGKRIRVYLDDMVVVEPLVMYIRSVPVIAAPFWFFPIGKKRKSGIMTFNVGNSADEGFYAKGLSYYWAINDYSDATFALDVMTRAGLRWSGEGVYAVGSYATGEVDASYIDQTNPTGTSKETRYSIDGAHSGRFLFGTKIDARADFQSDASYLADYSDNTATWLKNELESYVNITRTFKNLGSASIQARRYDDLQAHTSELNLPSIGLSLVSMPLFGGANLTSSFSAANNVNTTVVPFISDTLTQTSDTVHVTDANRSISPTFSLSLPRAVLGGFTLPLYGGYSEDVQTRDSLGTQSRITTRAANAGTGLSFTQNLLGLVGTNENFGYSENIGFSGETTHTAATYSLNGGAHTALYKIYDLEGFGLHGMLHKVSPELTFTYIPQTESRGVFGVPRFDTLPASSQFGLSLGNDFEVKVGDSMVKRDIGHLNFSTSYDLVTKLLPDINGDMELDLIDAPKTQLNLTGNTGFSTAARNFPTYSLTTHFEQKLAHTDTVHGGTTASIILDHYLGKDQDMLSAKLALALPPGPPQGSFTWGWNIGISGAWNITTGQITNYQLDVVKDLHCWEFAANYTRFGSRWSYDFKLRIKAIPDVALGKGLFSWMLPQQSN